VSSERAHKSPRNFTKPACWALLVSSALALVPVQNRIAGERGVYGPVEDILYMPSGTVIRRLSLGNEGLLADIYWTRVVQYFGRKRLDKDVRFDLMGPLLRVTTELDPHLLIAYRFGAIFLSGRAPEGAGHPKEALQLLRRGIVANPDYWRLWQDLGFVYYWDLKDYNHAVRAFTTGSEQPGAQVWLKALAAMVAAKGGDPQASKLLWTQIYRHAENQAMRESALDHLAALTAHEQIQELDELLDRYQRKEGRHAKSIRDLIATGFLRGVPLDPSGVPYTIMPDGKAGLGAHSKVKLRLIF
jgi:tetratricopeptide (TPR) repeat protein